MSFSRRSVAALFATLLCLTALLWLDAPAARADVIPDGKRAAELVFTLENSAEFPDWVVFVSRPSGGSHQVVEAGPVPGAGGRAYQTKYMPTLYAMKKSDYGAKRAAIDAPMPASGGDDDRLTKDPAILASKTSIVQNQWVAQSGPIAKIADVARITKLDASGFDIVFVKSTYILKDGSTKDVSWGSANDRPPFPGGEPSGDSSTGKSGSGSGSGAAAGGKAGCGCELAGGRGSDGAALGLSLFGALVTLLRVRGPRHGRHRIGVKGSSQKPEAP